MAPLNLLLIKVLSMVLTMFLIFVVALISGVFKYKMIAIGSDSMNPIYYRGDAIIYEKDTDIQKGDILVFEYDVELKKSEETLKEKNRNEKETLDKANKKI